MARNSVPDSKESNRLELLTVLLESYENSKFPVESPDPIDAIKFRMHERGLKQADLVQYLGTSSRVSEVLNRKRPLTVQMIRALSLGLGISADTLIGLSLNESPTFKAEVDWSKFPITEMVGRGWLGLDTKLRKSKTAIEEVVRTFIGNSGIVFGTASFRRSIYGDAQSPTTKYALYAWLARVIQRARDEKVKLVKFDPAVFHSAVLREIAQLSWWDKGPEMAVEFLEKLGVVVIFESHLKGTLLDGAALKDSDGTPIIAMTLRYDRLDNFWFTLLHELVHIWRHLDGEDAFLDDLDASSEDRREHEANRLAREAFIPRLIWKRSDAFRSPSKESIDLLARELKINPAVIAGRLRHESGNYQQFSDLLGAGEVRKRFFAEFPKEGK